MIFWSGYGILTPVIFIVSSLLTELIVGDIYYTAHMWPKTLGVVISSVLCFLIGRKLNNKKGKIYIDKETENEVVLRKKHTFFFIKIEYYAIVVPVLHLIFLLIDK